MEYELHPLVTIAMPVRNNATTVGAAVTSIMQQSFDRWQLLVIDDGSTDDTASVVRSFVDPRITLLVDGEQLGLPARLNQAIAMTQSPYFARMDGDDISYPQRLEKQIELLDSAYNIDLVGTSAAVFNNNGDCIGKRQVPVLHSDICSNPAGGFPMIHPTYVGRTEFFRKFRYNVHAIRCEDRDLLLRSYCDARFGNIPDILLGYRENQLMYRKQLYGRWFGMISMWQVFSKRKRFDLAFVGTVQQSAKCAIEMVAIATRSQHRLLAHRARTIDKFELAEWERVWASVNRRDVS